MLPTNDEILALLAQLDHKIADDLETEWLDFKPFSDPKSDLQVAVEYTVCFANAQGGVVVFGVADRERGRAKAIHGARGYDLDTWRRGIYQATNPNLSVEVAELAVPEGTGKLLVVRVPKGDGVLYGTSKGLYKERIGKNCMPIDPQKWLRSRVTSGAIDWSGQPATGVTINDLDSIEIARGRKLLQSLDPNSGLLKLDEQGLLVGLGAIRKGQVTNTGLLLFGREGVLPDVCPQHQVHYVHQVSDTQIARNDSYRLGLLSILERLEQIFSSSLNPEYELSVGLFKLRIPAFPLEVVREAVLNAVTHRDYSDSGEVLFRHKADELIITSPGGFLGGITPQNILRQEPISRNRTLAEAFEKLRLVERAGIGRLRIFVPTLSYGKRKPEYETDGARVTLRIFDGAFDERFATLIAKWQREGREVNLDGLLILSYLRQNAFIDSRLAAELLQLPRDTARSVLDQFSQIPIGILERRGATKAATYHLTKAVAKDLLGKAAYTRNRGIDPARYAEIVKAYVEHHGTITPRECRELLGLGESASAKSTMSKYLKEWSSENGFLRVEGQTNNRIYRLATT